MLSNKIQNRLSRPLSAAVIGAIATTASLFSIPAHAIGCEDVRRLSTAEQDYWSKQLNLSAQQRHQIWVACYQNWKQPKSEELARK
jgi:Spy/CpxP family protein refolding chaperone